jgi:hypothetical protein
MKKAKGKMQKGFAFLLLHFAFTHGALTGASRAAILAEGR